MLNEDKILIKKKNTKKIIMWSVVIISVIIVLIIGLMMSNSKTETEIDNSNKKYTLSELDFLKEFNTNEIFIFLDDDVNSELKGTYAFLRTENVFDGSDSIIALKKDNTAVEIIKIPSEENWDTDIEHLFYSDGMLYYEIDDERWGISLTEGNGIYTSQNYEFLNNYRYDWFYIANNKIYLLSSGSYGLEICDLTTEECELQVLNTRQDDLEIDGKKFKVDFNNVYVEDDEFIYIVSEDEKDIYKIDINNPTVDDALLLASYTKVDKIGKNAHLLSELNKLVYNDTIFNYEYNEEANFFIEHKSKKYELQDSNYRPITLLPNNYLMIEHYTDEESFVGEIEYINLTTGLKDENHHLEYNEWYGDRLYFITK